MLAAIATAVLALSVPASADLFGGDSDSDGTTCQFMEPQTDTSACAWTGSWCSSQNCTNKCVENPELLENAMAPLDNAMTSLMMEPTTCYMLSTMVNQAGSMGMRRELKSAKPSIKALLKAPKRAVKRAITAHAKKTKAPTPRLLQETGPAPAGCPSSSDVESKAAMLNAYMAIVKGFMAMGGEDGGASEEMAMLTSSTMGKIMNADNPAGEIKKYLSDNCKTGTVDASADPVLFSMYSSGSSSATSVPACRPKDGSDAQFNDYMEIASMCENTDPAFNCTEVYTEECYKAMYTPFKDGAPTSTIQSVRTAASTLRTTCSAATTEAACNAVTAASEVNTITSAKAALTPSEPVTGSSRGLLAGLVSVFAAAVALIV